MCEPSPNYHIPALHKLQHKQLHLVTGTHAPLSNASALEKNPLQPLNTPLQVGMLLAKGLAGRERDLPHL